MKRILLLAGLMLAMCASAYAQKSFNDEQLRLRGNIERFLREDGYMPEIDSDGDIKFKREGSSYYVIIDARDTSPMYLTLCKYYSYGEKYNRSVMSANLADFNLKKGVKLVLFDDSYSFQAQMYLVNADSFNYVFYKLLKQLDALEEDLDDICLSSGSGSSYSSGSNYSSGGTLLVNETFSSASYSWTAEDGSSLQFKNGKMVFKDLEDYGWAELTYSLPRNLRNQNFELSFSVRFNFEENYSALHFILGTDWDDCYRLGFSKWDDKISVAFGDYNDSRKYSPSSTSANLSPYLTHSIRMIKNGRNVKCYADGIMLFDTTIELSTDITSLGFLVSDHHEIEVDDVKVVLL